MTLANLVRRNPALTYWTIGALFWLVVWSPSVQEVLFFLGKAFLLPALAVQKALVALNGGSTVPWQGGLSILLGLALCLILDVAYRKFRSKRS